LLAVIALTAFARSEISHLRNGINAIPENVFWIPQDTIKQPTLTSQAIANDSVFEFTEVKPEFPGGDKALRLFVQTNVRYPIEAHKKGIQGRVVVQFVVGKDGSITDAHIVRSAAPVLDDEALRVVKAMPKWIPGMQQGQPVSVRYTHPFTFRIEKGDVRNAQVPKNSELPQDTIVQPVLTSEIVDGEPVYEVAEIMPEFPGGNDELMKFLAKNLRYPIEAHKKGIQGRVRMRFIVRKDGSLINAVVVDSVHRLLDNEALRVVKKMPKWTPGSNKGVPVNVSYTVPLTFRLESGWSQEIRQTNQRSRDRAGFPTSESRGRGRP
jgi:TonB family protein